MNNQLPLINNQQPLINNQQPVINNQLPLINNQQPVVDTPLPNINAPQPSINEILNDPKYQTTKDAEILKTFELAKLTREEAILVIHEINNRPALEIALNKLKPFIRT